MIDSIYQILKTIINKELRGNLTPTEFNLIATQAQEEIFRESFEDANRDKIKQSKGLTSNNFSNLAFNQRQRINKFSETVALVHNGTEFDLPADLYFIKHNGIDYLGKVVSETEGSNTLYLNGSLSAPSTTFPTYEMFTDKIIISPTTIIASVNCRYLRVPKAPKWTYTVALGAELFDNTISDFQDFELHESEFSSIVIRMLSYFGINIKDTEVAQYAEALKQKQIIKEEQ